MSSIEDPLVESLKSRLIGSSSFRSGISSVDTALSLQSRIHDHLFGIGLSATVSQVLSDDCKRLWSNLKADPATQDVGTRNLLNKILYNCQGLLHYHMRRPTDAKIYFSKSKVIELNYLPFEKFLNLENLYYRGLSDNEIALYGDELFKIIDSVPTESQGLTIHYLKLIFEHILTDNLSVRDDILVQFPSNNPLACFASLYLKEYEETEFLNIFAGIVERSSFPTADSENDELLENFHVFLHHYFKESSNLSQDWRKYIIESMEKTFQSIPVAKTALIYFGKNSIVSPLDRKEAILNFANYLKYAKRKYILHGNKHDNLVSLIDSYTYVLKIAIDSSNDVENVFNFDTSVKELLELLELMHKQNGFPLISGKDSLNWLENREELILPPNVSDTLAKAWAILFTIGKNSLNLLNDNSLTAYLTNALSISTDFSELYRLNFQYCYILAQKRLIAPAIKILETVLLEENPENYGAWHLLALCKSIYENKEQSFRIACSVLQAMQESFKEGKLTPTDRWQFVHLKMTQLRIVENIFGTLDALDMLPELFELYSILFPTDDEELTGIGTDYNQTKEYLLQLVWVFASGLYMRSPENYSDAKDAINESIRASKGFKNLNCNIAKGYLSLAENHYKLASKEFNTVLLVDPYNVDALVGLAKVVYQEHVNEICKYYRLSPPPSSESLDQKDPDKADSIFVSDSDKSANISRLKLLLESAITHSIEAYYSPDIWWYLSLIYEQYEDIGYEAALVNCIKYKETEPVHPFRYSDF